jgi:hypothetical protein
MYFGQLEINYLSLPRKLGLHPSTLAPLSNNSSSLHISPVSTFKSFQFLTYPIFKFDQTRLDPFNCISLHHPTVTNRMMLAATNHMTSASAEKTSAHQDTPYGVLQGNCGCLLYGIIDHSMLLFGLLCHCKHRLLLLHRAYSVICCSSMLPVFLQQTSTIDYIR